MAESPQVMSKCGLLANSDRHLILNSCHQDLMRSRSYVATLLTCVNMQEAEIRTSDLPSRTEASRERATDLLSKKQVRDGGVSADS